MLAGSHYRILKDDAVRPYTDLAPTLRDEACPVRGKADWESGKTK
jgi:hypothetical protein